MKGFLATFSTREYINIDNIQKIDTYCYNNYNLTSILSFRKCKVNEDIVLDCGVDGFYIECSPELHKLFLDTKMSLDEDYFTLFTKQLNIVIDPLLEDYVDYRSYIIEHFTLAEYKDDIYVFNLY